MALNYTEISALTQKFYIPKLIDNIFDSNALLQRAKSKWYDKIDGGSQIVVPVAYAATSASGWYSGAETLNTSANDQLTALQFDWKNIYANITVNRTDELQNSGKNGILNFVRSKVQMAEKTLSDNLGTAIFNDGTTDAKALVGLQLAIDSAGTYGGLSRTTYSWLAAQEDSSTTSLTIPTMQSLMGDCTIGGDKPTVIVGSQARVDDYYGLLQPQQRFTDNQTAKGGFTALLFNMCPVIEDSHATSTDLYFINEDYISLKVHKDEDFRFEPFIKPTNQNVSSAKVYWTGALAIDNCRMHGKFSALT